MIDQGDLPMSRMLFQENLAGSSCLGQLVFLSAPLSQKGLLSPLWSVPLPSGAQTTLRSCFQWPPSILSPSSGLWGGNHCLSLKWKSVFFGLLFPLWCNLGKRKWPCGTSKKEEEREIHTQPHQGAQAVHCTNPGSHSYGLWCDMQNGVCNLMKMLFELCLLSFMGSMDAWRGWCALSPEDPSLNNPISVIASLNGPGHLS